MHGPIYIITREIKLVYNSSTITTMHGPIYIITREIKLVYNSSTITMMHGPICTRFKR